MTARAKLSSPTVLSTLAKSLPWSLAAVYSGVPTGQRNICSVLGSWAWKESVSMMATRALSDASTFRLLRSAMSTLCRCSADAADARFLAIQDKVQEGVGPLPAVHVAAASGRVEIGPYMVVCGRVQEWHAVAGQRGFCDALCSGYRSLRPGYQVVARCGRRGTVPYEVLDFRAGRGRVRVVGAQYFNCHFGIRWDGIYRAFPALCQRRAQRQELVAQVEPGWLRGRFHGDACGIASSRDTSSLVRLLIVGELSISASCELGWCGPWWLRSQALRRL